MSSLTAKTSFLYILPHFRYFVIAMEILNTSYKGNHTDFLYMASFIQHVSEVQPHYNIYLDFIYFL